MSNYKAVDWVGLVYYDPTSMTGLRWAKDVVSRNFVKIRAGESAGYYDSSRGYYRLKHKKKIYYCHVIVFILNNGAIEDSLQVDHIDGVKKNNNINNLRLVTPSLNARNVYCGSRSKTGIVGVNIYNDEGYKVTWRCLNGKPKSKIFLFSKYGESAFMAACIHRYNMLSELNSNGAGYTDRHIGNLLEIINNLD